MSPATANRRRALRRLITTRNVGSQQELVELLQDAGHFVTQATVSRDLEAIGAVKERSNGRARYTLQNADGGLSSGASEAVAELSGFVTSIATSGNLVVVTTAPGAAHLVASAVDGAGFEGVLGTVAGDDTLIVVVAEHLDAGEIAAELDQAGGRR